MQNRFLSTRKLCAFACCAMGLWYAATAWAIQSGQAQVSEIKGYVYADGGFFQELTASSPGYSANLDANGFGNFGWRFSNTSGALQNVRFVVLLDADLDKATTTFFNEYGSFINLALPPGTMAGDVAATSWEIDEPALSSAILPNIFCRVRSITPMVCR